MSSSGYAAAPYLELAPSRRIAVVLTSVHAGAVASASTLALDTALRTALIILIACSLVYTLRRHVLRRGRRAVRALYAASDGAWYLRTPHGTIAAQLRTGSFAHPQLLVLDFGTTEGDRFSVLLAPDACDDDVYRRLLVRLRVGRDFGPPDVCG